MIQHIIYNTNDQLWLEDNKPIYCIDDGGLHYDFRVKPPYAQFTYDIEIVDSATDESHYYCFDECP